MASTNITNDTPVNPVENQPSLPLSSKSLNFAITVKLDDENHLLWKSQIMTIIRSHDLEEGIHAQVIGFKMKRYIDKLTAVGYKVTLEKEVQYILSGLDPEYEAFVTSINNRQGDINMSELRSLALIQESRIESMNIGSESIQQGFANLAVQDLFPNFFMLMAFIINIHVLIHMNNKDVLKENTVI
ncbi:hypothetical protein EZV62_018265 [Acer yangbiense]|uniref:Retrotransposon Copia-like N-terminal domain-containing protein n=1 Tax=Acer yangbiense TaxID=1000413 RepID=A0A5C7HKV1_9ROSI|nr:hypothetical protein EZV62_018265 [Acer yangbiense]